jgi:thioredoxin 1
MVGETPAPEENHLEVETDQTVSPQDVVSGRRNRFLLAGLGLAVLMLIGLLAPGVVISPSHSLAFLWAVPGSGLRGVKSRVNIDPPDHQVYTGESKVGPRMSFLTPVAERGGLYTELSTLDEFDHLVAQTSADPESVVVVKMYYKNCPACRKMGPRFDKFAKEYGGKKIQFAELEVIQHKDVAKAYGVKRVPSMQIFVGGRKEEDFLCGPKRIKMVQDRLEDYDQNGVIAIQHSEMHHTELELHDHDGALISHEWKDSRQPVLRDPLDSREPMPQ